MKLPLGGGTSGGRSGGIVGGQREGGGGGAQRSRSHVSMCSAVKVAFSAKIHAPLK